MAAIPATSYVKSDDVHVAYQVFGEGSLDLLFVPGFVSNIEAAWASPDHSAFFRRLASFCRVILFGKRGTGMSDRSSEIFTLEQRMHDVQAILDAVGCERAALRHCRNRGAHRRARRWSCGGGRSAGLADGARPRGRLRTDVRGTGHAHA